MEINIRLAQGEVLTSLEPLWLSLYQHHVSVVPQMGVARTAAESWLLRKSDYQRWLAEGASFVVVAEVDDEIVAYAFVRLRDNKSDTWLVDTRVAEVETLCVKPALRGKCVGEKVLSFIDSELDKQAVCTVCLGVMASNADAIRFYQKQGFEPALLSMTKKRQP